MQRSGAQMLILQKYNLQLQPLSPPEPEPKHTLEQYGSLFSDSDTSREHYRCHAIIFDTKYNLDLDKKGDTTHNESERNINDNSSKSKRGRNTKEQS